MGRMKDPHPSFCLAATSNILKRKVCAQNILETENSSVLRSTLLKHIIIGRNYHHQILHPILHKVTVPSLPQLHWSLKNAPFFLPWV